MINIRKTAPAPACLAQEKKKAHGDYKCGDVLERLQKDFYNKCYLCESQAPAKIEVDHFIPHRGNKQQKFAWRNLFYACGHCNNAKSAQYNTQAANRILNCTNPAHDVVNWLKYELAAHFPRKEVRITALRAECIVRNTARLLDEIYNGTTITKKLEAENLKAGLQKELIEFQGLLLSYRETEQLAEKEVYLRRIKQHLHKSSAFTAFKLWLVKETPTLQDLLQDG